MDPRELRIFKESYGSIYEGYGKKEEKEEKEEGCVPKSEKGEHNCAKKVCHEQFGEGQCIFGEHAEPDENGFVSHYDVLFGHGVEKNVPVSEMEVLFSESHGGHGKKTMMSHYEAEGEQLDEAGGPALPGEPGRPGTPKAPGGRPHLPGEKQTPAPKKKMTLQLAGADLFDIVKGHLMSEGYADTEEAALAIMANMSEEWKQDIVEAKYGTKAGRKALAKKIRKGEEIGKSGPGTGFKAVEKAAKEGGARDPKAVAAATMWKAHGGKKG